MFPSSLMLPPSPSGSQPGPIRTRPLAKLWTPPIVVLQLRPAAEALDYWSFRGKRRGIIRQAHRGAVNHDPISDHTLTTAKTQARFLLHA